MAVDDHGWAGGLGLLSQDQVADLLGVCRTTVKRLVRDGELEPVKIGRLTRVSVRSARAFIERGGCVAGGRQ
jgi:excisionase family DNA binding protein